MHDRYIAIPKKIDPISFYGNESPKKIKHIDRQTNQEYEFRYEIAKNSEIRLYQLGSYFDDKDAQIGDELFIEKEELSTEVVYYLDILRNGVSRTYGNEYKKFIKIKTAVSKTIKEVGEAKDDNVDDIKYRMAKHVLRTGQPKFKKKLLQNYNSTCAISNCDVIEVLEAAHIESHSDTGINHSSNGILLRADIHSLFDRNKIKINPDNFTIEVDVSLKKSDYWIYNNKKINRDKDGNYPSQEYLQIKYLKK